MTREERQRWIRENFVADFEEKDLFHHKYSQFLIQRFVDKESVTWVCVHPGMGLNAVAPSPEEAFEEIVSKINSEIESHEKKISLLNSTKSCINRILTRQTHR
jgi:hypothetical protein